MASRTEIILVDDLDGSEIHQGGETLRFTVDGADYEIDLSSANAEKFRSAVRPVACTRPSARITVCVV